MANKNASRDDADLDNEYEDDELEQDEDDDEEPVTKGKRKPKSNGKPANDDDEDDPDADDDEDEDDDEDDDPKKKKGSGGETLAQKAARLERELIQTKKDRLAVNKKLNAVTAEVTRLKSKNGATSNSSKKRQQDEDDDDQSVPQFDERDQKLARQAARILEGQRKDAVLDVLNSNKKFAPYRQNATWIVSGVKIGEDSITESGEYDEDLLRDAARKAVIRFMRDNPQPTKQDDDEEEEDDAPLERSARTNTNRSDRTDQGGDPPRSQSRGKPKDPIANITNLSAPYQNFFTKRMGQPVPQGQQRDPLAKKNQRRRQA